MPAPKITCTLSVGLCDLSPLLRNCFHPLHRAYHAPGNRAIRARYTSTRRSFSRPEYSNRFMGSVAPPRVLRITWRPVDKQPSLHIESMVFDILLIFYIKVNRKCNSLLRVKNHNKIDHNWVVIRRWRLADHLLNNNGKNSNYPIQSTLTINRRECV